MTCRIRKFLKRKRYMKAVLTVEASFIIPLILFTIVGGINIGFEMFKQAENAGQIQKELETLDPVEVIRTNTMIQEAAESRTALY